jgi:hypothetical protein
VNAARCAAGHLAEKRAVPHDDDGLDGIEFDLAAAFGGAVVIGSIVVTFAVVVAFNFARSLP